MIWSQIIIHLFFGTISFVEHSQTKIVHAIIFSSWQQVIGSKQLVFGIKQFQSGSSQQEKGHVQ